jgi:hypothetical protein
LLLRWSLGVLRAFFEGWAGTWAIAAGRKRTPLAIWVIRYPMTTLENPASNGPVLVYSKRRRMAAICQGGNLVKGSASRDPEGFAGAGLDDQVRFADQFREHLVLPASVPAHSLQQIIIMPSTKDKLFIATLPKLKSLLAIYLRNPPTVHRFRSHLQGSR